MRRKRIYTKRKTQNIKPKTKGGIIMSSGELFARYSTENDTTFPATIGEDGTIYKYDYSTAKYNVAIGVSKDTWNKMLDERDKYYALGVEHGYIKTPEQIEAEKLAEKERKEKEDADFKTNMLKMVEDLTRKLEKYEQGNLEPHKIQNTEVI